MSSFEPIHCLIFSKSRAMQLDALLRSLERYSPYETVTVVAVAPDGSYERCREENKGRWSEWIYDSLGSFETVVRTFLDEHRRVGFHVDDEVMFNPIPIELLRLDNSEVVLTLRQGRNTIWCHPRQSPQRVPESFPWKWREADLDFGYPLSVCGTVFNSRDLVPLMNFSFTDPNQLEAQLAAKAHEFAPELMTAPETSCVVSLPLNVVSKSSGNPRGDWPDYQPAALERFYLQGWRIDPFRLDYSRVDAAHVELPLVFTRRS